MAFDLILRNGRVIDPSQNLDRVTDVAFAGGKVAKVGERLESEGAEVRDVSGLIVTPGLIDLHTHVYWGGTSLGIDAEDFARRSAVTTCVDTGSAGPGNFAGFRKHVIERSAVRILPVPPCVLRRDLRLLEAHHGGRGTRHPAARCAGLHRRGRSQPRPHRRHQGPHRAGGERERRESCRWTSPNRSPTRPACR